MRNKVLFFSTLLLLFLVATVSANLNETNSTALNDTIINSTLLNSTNLTNITNSTPVNQTLLENPLFLRNILPSTFKIGDAQFNIQIENKGNTTLENIIPLISGPGFFISNIIPIDVLSPNSIGYILVTGTFTHNGTIPLEIRIDNQRLSYNLTVNSEYSPQVSDKIIIDLTSQLNELKQNYSLTEKLISNKADLGYDVSSISLSDTKKYLRDAESALLTSNINNARANLKLASDELNDQSTRLETVKKIPFFSKFKSNALAFSAVAGALVTIFAAYELLKKKGSVVHSVVVSKVQEVKGKVAK